MLENQHQTPAVCILIIERFFFFFHSLTGMLSLKFTACHIFQPSTMCAWIMIFVSLAKGSLIGEILHIAELREFGDSFFLSWSCCEKGVTLSTSKSPKWLGTVDEMKAKANSEWIERKVDCDLMEVKGAIFGDTNCTENCQFTDCPLSFEWEDV